MNALGKAVRTLLAVTTLAGLAQASTDAFGAASTTTLTSTPNPSAFGETVTLKAVVGSAGAPTGTVTFTDGATSLGDVAVDTLGVGQPIAAGLSHICALTGAGGVKCWGLNNRGQLGNATNVGTNTANPNLLDVTGLGSGVVAITAGDAHTCALTSAGGVKCWGYNFYGQLGSTTNIGTITANPDPIDVSGLSGVVAIAAGGFHTCALTSAGGVKCWGRASSGQIGNEAGADNPTPTDVNGLGSGVAAIAAGLVHTCAVTNAGGVKCWGSNMRGQLGSTTNSGNGTPNPAPLDVTGLESGVTAIAAREWHTCALTTAGGVKCWGHNNYGQLGRTTNAGNSNPNPDPLDVSGLGSGVAAIAAGATHTCAMTSAGGLKCWGRNLHGQLGSTTGVGTTNPNPAPLDVTGLDIGVASIAAGGEHTCALTNAAFAECWGWNAFGQLGNPTNSGTDTPNATPLDVSGLTAMVFGKAALETAALAVGAHSLTAEYSGDADPSTSEPVSHFVPRITTSVALDSSLNPSAVGQSVTFTATVSSPHGPPEGTVMFRKNGSNFALRTLVGGVATLETAALPPGTHSITARYQRSDDFRDSSSAPVSQEVAQGQTTTTLRVRPSTSVPGQPVNLIATVQPVAPAGGKPKGTVTFSSGETELGTAAVINLRAMLTVDDFAIGNHSITASYGGETNFAASTSSASAAVVSPLVGAAFNVNRSSADPAVEKGQPAIARLSDDGFVVAWQQQTATEGWNILARRFQANGKPADRQFRVNTARVNDQTEPSVTGLSGGGFVVVWTSSSDVFGQRYDANGTPVGRPFRVNTVQADDQFHPAVAPHGDGFVVVWTSRGQDGPGGSVYGQRYDSAGAPIGAAFAVDTTDLNQPQPAVAALADGGFVVTWTSADPDAAVTWDIYAQRYDLNGDQAGEEFRVNTTQAGAQSRSTVSGLAGAGFVVAWEEDQDGNRRSYAQVYDAAGAPIGGEFPVNVTGANDQFNPSVAAFPDGGFVVVWVTSAGGSGLNILGQAYDADGSPVEGEFPVNTATAGHQGEPRAVGYAAGRFVAVWTSVDASEYSIVAQRGQVQGLGGP